MMLLCFTIQSYSADMGLSKFDIGASKETLLS
jgi:hypothetical protein